LLTETALQRVHATHDRFCATADCPVVHFGDAGDRFERHDIRVPVWQKEPPARRLLCYCFGETEAAIRAELAKKGSTDAGYRRYSDATVRQVRFITQAQSLGLTFDDIKQLIIGQERRSHGASCRTVRDLLMRRIKDIAARMKELRDFRRTLHDHLSTCERALAEANEPACPTIEALDRPTRRARSREDRHAISPTST
jgi:MerR family copper efflux transcriptional regulator